MSKNIPAELQEQIESEADDYAEKTGDRINGIYRTDSDRRAGYEEGATKYATLLVEAQERVRQLEIGLERIQRYCFGSNDKFLKRIKGYANEALTPKTVNSKEDEKAS